MRIRCVRQSRPATIADYRELLRFDEENESPFLALPQVEDALDLNLDAEVSVDGRTARLRGVRCSPACL
jgi:hypothetical protein